MVDRHGCSSGWLPFQVTAGLKLTELLRNGQMLVSFVIEAPTDEISIHDAQTPHLKSPLAIRARSSNASTELFAKNLARLGAVAPSDDERTKLSRYQARAIKKKKVSPIFLFSVDLPMLAEFLNYSSFRPPSLQFHYNVLCILRVEF